MNYKDLENISYLSQQILTEAASEEHDVMNRWPYSSPYLQEERAPGVKPYRANPTQAEVRAAAAAAERRRIESGADEPGYRPEKESHKTAPLLVGNPGKAGDPRGPEWMLSRTRMKPHTQTGNPTRIMGGDIGAGSTRRGAEVLDIRKGKTRNISRSRRLPSEDNPSSPKPSKKIIRHKKQHEEFKYWVNSLLDEGYDLSDYTWDEMAEMYIFESYNLYDIVLAHLIDEGYTDTIDGANAIMANMSEEWRDDIVEEVLDEASRIAVASPAPAPGDRRKSPYTKEVRNSGATKTSPAYSNTTNMKKRMNTPLSKQKPEMQYKGGM